MSQDESPSSEQLALFMASFFVSYTRAFLEAGERESAAATLQMAEQFLDASFPLRMGLRAVWTKLPETSAEGLREAVEECKHTLQEK